MPSTIAPFNGHGQISQDDTETPFSPHIRLSSRRTLSFSSSPSFSSSNSSDDNSCPSPTTTLKFSGQIPFSWEKIPGIPKNVQIPKENNIDDPSLNFLPLPPSVKKINKKEIFPTPQKKHHANDSFRKDPFFAALVKCSKGNDEHDSIGNFCKSSRVARTLSDRLGFVSMYTSCKSTFDVSESIVYLPRSSTHDLYPRRSS